MAVLGWTVRPPSATRLVRNHPLVSGLNNAWVPYSVVQTPNLVNGPPLVVGNATAATVFSGTLGAGAGTTANGFTNLFTSTSTAAWTTAVGIFRLRGTAAGVPLFGNNSQGAAIYTDGTGHLSLFVSSGSRLSGATVLGSTDTFVVGYRNDQNAGYELYLNGVRDDAGGVTGWGNIGALTAIGTAGTAFSVAVDCFGLFTWDRNLTPAEHFAFARNPWQVIARAPGPIFAPASGGGTTYNVTVAEAGTAADTESATAAFAGTAAETASAADTPSATAAFGGAVAEAGSGADTTNAAASMGVAVSESGAAADTRSAVAVFPATVAETGSAADTSDADVTNVQAVTEAASAADATSATVVYAASVSEVGAAVDTQDATGGTAAQTTGGVAMWMFPQPSRTREWLAKAPRKVRRAVERAVEKPAQARAIVRDALDDIDDVEQALEALEMMQKRHLATLQALSAALAHEDERRAFEEQDEDDVAALLLLH